MKIRPLIIWFLSPDADYTNRRLEIAYCPKCDKLLAKYTKENIITGNISSDTYSKWKAEKIMDELSTSREYTSWDLFKQKGLYGFRYGENKEIKKGNKKVLVQRAVDFYGNKEIVNTSPIK